MHVSLAVFTLAFVVLHVLVLATDSYAGVGLRGAVLPMAATYRPVPVTMGVLGAYAGVLAGRHCRARRPGHRAGLVADPQGGRGQPGAGLGPRSPRRQRHPGLLVLYGGSGLLVAGLALSRYVARTPTDRVAELTTQRAGDPPVTWPFAGRDERWSDAVREPPARRGPRFAPHPTAHAGRPSGYDGYDGPPLVGASGTAR